MKSLLRGLFNRTPVPYTGRLNISLPSSNTRGMESQMRAMGAVGTLFAIVSRTSNAVSQVDWKLYRKAVSGNPEDRQEVTRHPALDLWNMPNPFMPRQEFVETFQQHLELAGEGWWLLARSGMSPLPLELWPVRPDRMEPIPHPTDFLSGYVYRSPDGVQVPLERQEAIFLRTPDPLDIYRGLSPVRAIMNDLEGEQAAAEWNRNFFLNSAVPGGILQTEKRLGDDAFNELRDRWAEQHRGVGNAHRVAILEQGLEWKERGFNQRDMEFTSLRTVASEKIREAYGFPLPLLGTATGSNRAIAEAANFVFARWLVVPRLERIKAALNTELLPMFGPGSDQLEFDYDNPVPEDIATDTAALTARANAAVALVNAGWNAEDVLDAVGLPKLRYGVLPPKPAAPTAPSTVPAVPDTPEALVPLAALSMFNLQRAQRRAAELEADAPDLEDALRWEVVAKVDDNVCLAPEVRVTTQAGLVPAKDVTLDDELLTHAGQWVRPSRIVVSQVEEQLIRVRLADGRTLRLTWDHPVFVRSGEGFAWRNAGDLAVGDLVVDQSSLELGEEAGGIDVGFGQAPDGVPTGRDVLGLPSVDVWPEAVPVRSVCLDDESVTDHEVDDPRADLNLRSVGVPQVFEGLTDAALNAGLGVAGAVAADAAVPLAGGLGRDDAELASAVLAGCEDGRASARLGAVLPDVFLRVAEGCAAADTGTVPASVGVAAHAGAVGVSVSVADGDAELDAASSAGLCDSSPCIPGGDSLGHVLGIGVHALARAVELVTAPLPSDLGGAGLACRRRPSRVISQPSGANGTTEAERASLDRYAAARTRLIHARSVQVTTVQITAVEREPHVGEVYDFTIPGDHTFWAEGVLVHNCDPCLKNDGHLYRNREDAYKDYPGGSNYVNCIGEEYGNQCRCRVVKRGKKGRET